jgi:hypothetical protein
MRRAATITALLVGLAACRPADTSHLSAEQEARFARESVRFRAPNQSFRFTHDAGTRESGWEERIASIVVTDSTVLIYKNEKIGIEITPASRRDYEVHRDGDRVRISAGSGKSRETWSFTPPDNADGWTTAIRAVIKSSAGAR